MEVVWSWEKGITSPSGGPLHCKVVDILMMICNFIVSVFMVNLFLLNKICHFVKKTCPLIST